MSTAKRLREDDGPQVNSRPAVLSSNLAVRVAVGWARLVRKMFSATMLSEVSGSLVAKVRQPRWRVKAFRSVGMNTRRQCDPGNGGDGYRNGGRASGRLGGRGRMATLERLVWSIVLGTSI